MVCTIHGAELLCVTATTYLHVQLAQAIVVLLDLHGHTQLSWALPGVCVCVVGSNGMSLCGHYHVVCVTVSQSPLTYSTW